MEKAKYISKHEAFISIKITVNAILEITFQLQSNLESLISSQMLLVILIFLRNQTVGNAMEFVVLVGWHITSFFFIHVLVRDKGSLCIVTLNFCNKKKKLIFSI